MSLTFRNSKIIYYGPHECTNCSRIICKMGSEFGGNAFDYPQGPVYPNTEWHPHVCDQKDVELQAAKRESPPGVDSAPVFTPGVWLPEKP